MPRNLPGFELFLRRVHRRHLALHLLEGIGLGILVASLAALPLVLVMVWRQESAAPLTSAALALGAVAGLTWGFLTRPGKLAAALEADRQLHWADLLSSAMTVRARAADDPWALAVLATADAQCSGVSPSSVVLNRLGARAWGGIGLATALLAVLTLVPAYSTAVRAGDENTSIITNSNAAQPSGQERQYSTARESQRRAVDQPEPEDSHSSQMGMTSTSQQAETSPKEAGAPESSGQPREESSSSAGHGQSRSNPENAGRLPTAANATDSQDHAPAGGTSAGVGRSASNPSGRGTASGSIAGSDTESHPIPPWTSPDWPVNVQRARQSVSSGQIPAAYRDLVRDYFDRP